MDGDLGQIAVEARTALAECRDRHGDVVAAYNDVRDEFGPQ